MMNYSTRQPAHSWEDTLLLFSTPSPSSLTLSSPSSFLLVFNSFSLSFPQPHSVYASTSTPTTLSLSLSLCSPDSFLLLSYMPITLLQSHCNTWSKEDGSVNREEPKGGAVGWNSKQVTWLRHPLSPSCTHRAPLSFYTPSVVSNLLLLSLSWVDLQRWMWLSSLPALMRRQHNWGSSCNLPDHCTHIHSITGGCIGIHVPNYWDKQMYLITPQRDKDSSQ